MGDLADVEIALVGLVAAGLGLPNGYLAGDYQPSTVTGTPTCRVARGWPVSDELDADLALGRCTVTVFPEAGMTRDTTRYQITQQSMPAVPCSLLVSVSGTTATFTGMPVAGQLAGVRIGPEVTGLGYSYLVPNGATLTSIAAALAALAPGGSSTGAVITAPGLTAARTAMTQTTYREMARQEQGFRLSCWCPTPMLRDAVAAAVN